MRRDFSLEMLPGRSENGFPIWRVIVKQSATIVLDLTMGRIESETVASGLVRLGKFLAKLAETMTGGTDNESSD